MNFAQFTPFIHHRLLPLIVLPDVGERSDLHPGDVGVLVQHVDVVMGRDPDDGGLHQPLKLLPMVSSLLRHDLNSTLQRGQRL